MLFMSFQHFTSHVKTPTNLKFSITVAYCLIHAKFIFEKLNLCLV